MKDKMLLFARTYEKAAAAQAPAELRPAFHLTPYIGWMNDPNGFSFYNGEYHLFYQYNPYSTVWDSMHWGHAVSKDLLHWTQLPCALAPDQPYDYYGCFSGSAAALPDGRQLIIYTGVSKEAGKGSKDVQVQCIAVGDGVNYTKYEANPVLDASCLPAGLSKNDFRDPKIWQEPDGSYRCVVGARIPDEEGYILLCSSPDGFRWKFESVLVNNDGRFGRMWECPDFFPLDGRHVLLTSPQDMQDDENEYHTGNGTLCLIGDLDAEGKHFAFDHDQTVDSGIDFYAPQTTEAPDGRRIMIAWMQNWDACDQEGAKDRQWFGQMTLPREITIRNGRLYQQPVREFNALRGESVSYQNVPVSDSVMLDGIEGRIADMEMVIRPNEAKKFTVKLAQDERFRTELTYDAETETLLMDRRHSGVRRGFMHTCSCKVPLKNGELKLRVILDKYSAEVFVGEGERAMTMLIATDASAKGISFCADGAAELDITKYDLKTEG